MRILLLADLHSHVDWLHWVATCGAKSADLTAIAGDLLDGFRPAGLLPQMMALRKWTETFPGQLVVSSGNHDANIEGGAVSGELWEICDRGAAREILIRALSGGCEAPANRAACTRRTASTRARTADEASSAAFDVNSAYSTGGASTWMSMRSRSGPETRCR